MDNDNDFTFCQVVVPVDKDGLDVKNLASDVRDIASKDECSNGSTSSILWKDGLPGSNDVFKMERTVGSMSYNVFDASSQKQSSDRQGASGDAGTLVKNFQEQKPPSTRKPKTRAKVPFEKGYSQMDWLKLTRTHPDLAGLKGQSNKRLISTNEVELHQTEGSMWTVLKGCVYNLSPYMKFHPGGVDMLMKAVGKDCTSLFNKYHAWVNAEFLLEKCLVGTLDVDR